MMSKNIGIETVQDKIDAIDEILMRLEDYIHGQDGKDITNARKSLAELEAMYHNNFQPPTSNL